MSCLTLFLHKRPKTLHAIYVILRMYVTLPCHKLISMKERGTGIDRNCTPKGNSNDSLGTD